MSVDEQIPGAMPGSTPDDPPRSPDAKIRKNRSGRKGGRGDQGERGPRRGTDRQATHGWGDGIERCRCEALSTDATVHAFPVRHRTELAAAQPFIVAVKDDAVLYCTLTHPGVHIWPGGEVVDDPLTTPPATLTTADRTGDHSAVESTG